MVAGRPTQTGYIQLAALGNAGAAGAAANQARTYVARAAETNANMDRIYEEQLWQWENNPRNRSANPPAPPNHFPTDYDSAYSAYLGGYDVPGMPNSQPAYLGSGFVQSSEDMAPGNTGSTPIVNRGQSSTPTGALQVSLTSSSGMYRSGDTFTLSITNAPVSSDVIIRASQNGMNRGQQTLGRTDHYGKFTLQGTWNDSHIGNWTETISVQNHTKDLAFTIAAKNAGTNISTNTGNSNANVNTGSGVGTGQGNGNNINNTTPGTGNGNGNDTGGESIGDSLSFLTDKYGPLPLYAWIGLGASVLGFLGRRK